MVESKDTASAPGRTDPTMIIRADKLPPKWPKYLPSVLPVNRVPGLGAWLARSIVGNTYHPSVYPKSIVWSELNEDERYACASTVWFRAASKIQYQGTGIDRAARVERMARRMYGCYPCGVRGSTRPKRDYPCESAICPYCYARSVVNMFSDLTRAYSRRPDDSKIWISPFYQVDEKKKFMSRLRKIRPACATVFYHPIGSTEADKTWSIRGVMMTDDAERFAGRKYVRKVYNSKSIAKAISSWMRYPVGWYRGGVIKTACEMTHVFSTIPVGAHRYSSHGVCRDDCMPGRSLFDFAAYDKGAPPGLMAGYSRKEGS